jgi:tetraprenyl-beta-curcumene synthase
MGRNGMAVLTALCIYQGRVLPAAREELRDWRRLAQAIPDPVLRRGKCAAITEKAANAEATAVFATLAPGANRSAATRAMTALQIAIDYLDGLGENAGSDPLDDGLRLHEALRAAVDLRAPTVDWYALHPRGEDGGYLDRLVAECRKHLRQLPSYHQVLPILRRAVVRCGEGQSHTHAAAVGGRGELEAWATGRGGSTAFSWWELAAGASSSVSAHALIAAAAEPGSSESEAEAIDAAYFPAIGALTVLLDDLVDRDLDLAGGDHNYMDYYDDGEMAAERLAAITDRSRAAIATLSRHRRHVAILSGVVAFYLAAPEMDSTFARPVRDRLPRSAGGSVRPLAAFLRLRRDDPVSR